MQMPVFTWYRQSFSPEVKEQGKEIVRRMIEQFDNYTVGNARLIYGNGSSFNVHVFNNLTYRLINPKTTQPTGMFTCLELDSKQVNEEGQYQLITEEKDSKGIVTAHVSNVLFLEETVLSRDVLQRLLN
ncbi:hypothetical protein DFH28DRAFT_927262 [Melampsora americana]|nr:hypothetical protein DFH28DRAFT_927262 [Melampsora americana]